MKKYLGILLLLVAALQLNAQKIKIVSGDLKALNGQTGLDISFTYSDEMKVGKMTEDDYITKKMAEAEEEEPGRGEKWKEMWYEDRPAHFEPMFVKLINEYLAEVNVKVHSDFYEPSYMLVVNTVFIEPGFNVGVAKKNASVNLEVFIVSVDDSSKVLTKITITGAPGRSWGHGDYDTGIRVGEAYAKAGKELARFLIKKKAF